MKWSDRSQMATKETDPTAPCLLKKGPRRRRASEDQGKKPCLLWTKGVSRSMNMAPFFCRNWMLCSPLTQSYDPIAGLFIQSKLSYHSRKTSPSPPLTSECKKLKPLVSIRERASSKGQQTARICPTRGQLHSRHTISIRISLCPSCPSSDFSSSSPSLWKYYQ